MEKVQLIDVLSEDDFLVDDSLQDFRVSVLLDKIDEDEDLKLIRTVCSQEAENAADVLKQREQKVLLSESMERGRASDLRKSLAWDSSFFTSAGVLDPDELLIINQGFEKSESHLLPKIRQDIRKRGSVDLDYTWDSDGFSFESNQSTEVDLFEDIRASIQRSSMMSNVFKSGCKSGVGEACKQKPPKKKLDDISRNKVKSVPLSRKQTVQQAARNGESNLFFRKPPKMSRTMNPVSAGQTKKILSGAESVKMEKNTAMSGSRQGLIVSKKSGSGNSCCSTSSTASPNSSSSVSVAASNDSTASWSPPFKSSSNSRRKTDSRKSKLAATGGSSSKTPPKCSPEGTSGLGNHGLSTHSLPMSNHSSYASPANSIDGRSSESSSTSANHISNFLDASFCNNNSSGACFANVATHALDLQSHSRDQSFYHQESQQRMLLNQHIDEVTATGTASAESTRNLRPSGLRMPSPKIGFFDEEKSPLMPVSGGLHHFGAPRTPPSINGATNGKTLGKPQSPIILAQNGNMKLGSGQTGVLYPASSTTPSFAATNQEPEKNSPKVSSSLATSRNFPGKASIGQIDRENCSKARKIGDGVRDTRKLGPHSNLKAERKRSEGIFKNEVSSDTKRHVRLRANKIRPSKGEPLVHNGDIKSRKQEKEKENLPSLEDHVNGLSRYFEAIDLNKDVVIELNGKKKGCSNSLSISTAVDFIPGTRTPLADRNSASNGTESFGFTAE